MERVAVDYIEKLTPDRWGNDMIIVIIDCFSRFVMLYAVQSTKAKVFVDTFIKWISVFTEPKEVLSDQESQFLSNLVRELYELTNIKCVFTTPNSKQEKAIVERANREVMRHLRSIVYDERVIKEWSLHLPFSQRIMNSMIHSSTGVKPCQIFFGREFSQEFIHSADGEGNEICVLKSLQGIEEDNNQPTSLRESNTKLTTDHIFALGVCDDEDDEESWLKDIKDAQRRAIEVARDHLISRDMKHMLKAPTKYDEFEEGEYVLVEQGSSFRRGPDDKLLPFLSGPYIVLSKEGSAYTLRNCITQKTKTVHLSTLTAYRVREYHRTPAEAAMRDFDDVFLVQEIVGGESDNNLKGPVSGLKFRVSWVGFPGQDTVESWRDIRNLEQFRKFLSEHSSKEYRDLVKIT